MRIDVKSKLPSISEVEELIGVDRAGDVQMFLTQEIRRRMTRCMPYRTGTTATKLTRVISPTEIEVDAPYARNIYLGITATGKKIQHWTRDFNPLAGPFWDETEITREGKDIVASVEAYTKWRRMK